MLVARLVTGNAVVRIDLARASVRVLALRGHSPGDPPHGLASSGGRLVYYGRSRT